MMNALDKFNISMSLSPDLDRVGGALCLDFANTNVQSFRRTRQDPLAGFASLVAWCRDAGAANDEQVKILLAAEREFPKEAQLAMQVAWQGRAAIWDIFSALAEGSTVPGESLSRLNHLLFKTAQASHLVAEETRCRWEWSVDPVRPHYMLWPIAHSAAELLMSDALERLKRCPPPEGCGRLFLDTSRNHSRRWCSMASCGNRTKGRRHYHMHGRPAV